MHNYNGNKIRVISFRHFGKRIKEVSIPVSLMAFFLLMKYSFTVNATPPRRFAII